MRGPTCTFWADLTPFSLEAAGWTAARVLRGWDPLQPSQQPYCWDGACDGDPDGGLADKRPPRGLKTEDAGARQARVLTIYHIGPRNVSLASVPTNMDSGDMRGEM
jgi:hypothetical protein